MCIEQVTAWSFAGKHYSTERNAVLAAIDHIGRQILKDYASNPGTGLTQYEHLPSLLRRYRDLAETDDVAAPECAEGTQPESPEGTQPEGTQGTPTPFQLHEAVAQMRAMGAPAKAWLQHHEFANVQDFISKASRIELDKWAGFMAGEPEEEDVL